MAKTPTVPAAHRTGKRGGANPDHRSGKTRSGEKSRRGGGAGPRGHARGPRPTRRSDDAETGWIWGKHAGLAAIANPKRDIHEVLATRNAARDLPDGLREAITTLDPSAIDAALPQGAVHQGLAVRCSHLSDRPLEDLIARPGPILVLDQVTDPHNVGALVRSAAAFGAAGMVLQDRKAPPFMGACAKAAVGAVERLPHARVVNIARAVEEIRAAGGVVIGLAGGAELTLSETVEAAGDAQLALVLGSEDKGLRPGVAEACSSLGRIPIDGAVESLNVSTAGAVALYALGQRSAR